MSHRPSSQQLHSRSRETLQTTRALTSSERDGHGEQEMPSPSPFPDSLLHSPMQFPRLNVETLTEFTQLKARLACHSTIFLFLQGKPT